MSRVAVRPPRTEAMTTRDGTTLVADVWEPDAPGPHPVLLMRQAYGRRIGTSLCYAPPAWYASHGFIVVIQDVRGRGDSGGDFALFRHEAADGADSVAWAARLPGANGRVGMFGFSFQGTNQLLALAEPCPALRAVAPAMIGWDLRTDWAYENGAFPLRANLGWAVQLMAETARRAGDHAAQAELFALGRALPLHGAQPGRPEFMRRLGHWGHYGDWADRPEDDAGWRAISPAAHLEAIVANRPAVFLVGGWYDSHLPGTLAAWRALHGRLPLRLVVGPWAHFPWDRRIGDRDFGDDAVTDIDQQQVAWFDRWLRHDEPPEPESVEPAARDGVEPQARGGDEPQARGGVEPQARGGDEPQARGGDEPQARGGVEPQAREGVGPQAREGVGPQAREGVVRLFDMGASCWREMPALPGPAVRLWPAGTGRAAIDMRDGRLAEAPPAPSAEHLVHDPWRPPAPCGGSYGQPPGPIDRHATDARADVLTFTTEAVAQPRLLCGAVAVQLDVETDARSFDLHATLSLVAAAGAAHPLAEGYGSFTAGQGPCRLPMRATCATIAPGERLRLSVAAACHPAFAVNPGTGARPWDATLDTLRVVTLVVRTGAGTVLHLPLPSPETPASEPPP